MQNASCGGDLGQRRNRAGRAWPAGLLVAGLLVAAAPGASAADGTWNGTSGDWTSTAIWDGGIVADGAGSTASFIATLTASNNDFTGDVTVTGGTLALSPDGELAITATSAANGTDGFANDLAGGSFAVLQSGSSLNLVFSPVPEPSAALLVLTTGLAALRLIRRSRLQRRSPG